MTTTQSRRQFLRSLLLACGCDPSNQVMGENTVKYYAGTQLLDWNMSLGDGICNVPTLKDIKTVQINQAYTELRANLKHRAVMAHNITFKRFIADNTLDFIHICEYQFRLPYIPATNNTTLNGQTLEGGIFIWDGCNTRMDYGVAFQWVLNPWSPLFKKVQCWTGSSWQVVGELTPDTRWHRVKFVLNYRQQRAQLWIDGKNLPCLFTLTAKDSLWGTEIAARLQAEIISLDVCQQSSGTLHKAQFRNWSWQWQPYT